MTGVAEDDFIRQEVWKILDGFDPRRENLIPILQRMQARLGFIPMKGMEAVAGFLRMPVGEIYGVATFYNQFRLVPPGKYQIRVCTGTACHVKRSYVILEEWKRRLGIQEGQTTEDRLFGLETVPCVGCCALAPVVVIRHDSQETFYGHMMTSKVNGLILEIKRREGIDLQG